MNSSALSPEARETLFREAAGLAAEVATESDREGSPAEAALERFGALGAFRLGLAGGHPEGAAPAASQLGDGADRAAAQLGDGADRAAAQLGDYARLLEAVAGECLSSAFSLWAHRMVVEYLYAAGGFDELLEDLLAGRRAGSIAMATAMQELAGVGSIPTIAVPEGDGYRVSGRIAWASNIAPGTVIVFPARVAGAGAGGAADEAEDRGERVILTTVVGADGLTVREVQDLLALGATRSAMLQFDGVLVPAGGVVAASLDVCRARRHAHLLLQSAFCLGLAARCLAEAGQQLAGPGGVLAAHHARLSEQHRELADSLHAYADDRSAAGAREVTLLRYEAARLAGAAARHEATLVGGRGYVTTSATNRRLREATFLPVQSPSEVQLLQELEGFGLHLTEGYSI
ncbi:MAG: hypothetical protein AB7V10_07640 [Leucobacter sp.]